jgi:mRNA interferase MazF
VVVCVAAGSYGKPRPAVIVQSDLFNPTHASVVVCPITSHMVDAPLFRLTLQPNRRNGLRQRSQIMIDKLVAVQRDKIADCIGKLSDRELVAVDRALALWLELGKAELP